MNTCKSCKNWRPIREGYGECHEIMEENPGHFPVDDKAVLWLHISQETGGEVYTYTEEDICEEQIYTDNSLMTRESFGCVLHEEGPNRK